MVSDVINSLRESPPRSIKGLLATAALAGPLVFVSLASAQEKMPPIKQLDPLRRRVVVAVLGLLIFLGFAMVLLAWLGARVTRRYMKGTSYFRPTPRPTVSDWTPQPLKAGDKLADEPDSEGKS